MKRIVDVNCDCGNPDCHDEIMFRKGAIYDKDGMPIPGWLHILATDMEGQTVELMVSPKSARWLLWWFIKNFWRK